ncbi:phage tail protein [Enterobacter soli]|uniref:phage tail protein n=1 Tax=Enterobacter soli TaxID=885040 RepID=UPI0034CD32FD
MTAKYFAILTNQGAARLANATALGTKLNLTQMAVGDANGALPVPDPAQTKLVNQKRIAPLNLLAVDPNNSSQIIAEQIIPENEGGFWIREIGLYDDEGVLIAIANCPETYKPQLQEGSGRTQTIRMILIVSSTSSISLKIDPSVVLATRQYVDDKVIEVKGYADDQMKKHIAADNPHKQYPLIKNALKEIADAGLSAEVLKNLGLGNAVYVISRGSNAAGSWTIWSDGTTEIMGAWQSITNGLATVTYPIALPSVSRMISIAERTSTDPGMNTPKNIHTSTILDDTVTKTGFKARCQLIDGQASSSAFSWRVYAPV